MKNAITVLFLIICVSCKQGKNEYKKNEFTIGDLGNLKLELSTLFCTLSFFLSFYFITEF